MNQTLDPGRRNFLGTLAALGALGTTPALAAAGSTAESETALRLAAERPPQLKPLAFDPAKLKGLSERLIRSHWENNYGGSVKALSIVRKHLAEALSNDQMPPFIYNELKREHLLRTGSVVLHEYYFDNLGGGGRADSAVRKAIAAAFGSFEAWEAEFRRMGAGMGGGSGWVVLGFNVHIGRLENYWLADHAHGAAVTLPILVMDMYEHSYQMDFGAAAGKYIDAFFDNIQWDAVARRIEAAVEISGRLSGGR